MNVQWLETLQRNLYLPAQIKQLISALCHWSFFRRLSTRNGVVVSFGETNLFATTLIAFLTGFASSIGVRSDVVEVQKYKTKRSHSSYLKRKLKFIVLKAMWGFCYRAASQIVTQTDFERTGAIDNFRLQPERVLIVQNDIPQKSIDYSQKMPRLPDIPKKFLFIGNQNALERKGWYLLRDCLPSLKQAVSSVECLSLINITRQESQHVQKRQYGFKIHVYPYVVNLLEIMACHDVVLVPSYWDPSPNVALEAIGLGIPVIGSNTPGLAAILQTTNLLFENGNQHDFLRCLANIAKKEGYASAKTSISQIRKRYQFDWESVYIDTIVQATTLRRVRA
jgi:glycosyltransferase involved in cell wall biosynthesis